MQLFGAWRSKDPCQEKKSYKATKTALYLLGIAVMLQLVEWVVKQQNIEFRTFMQVPKGIYLWLIVPITLVFSVYHDFFRERSRAYFRYLVPTVFTVFIVGASCFRGVYYFFNMVEEKVLEDGIIQGSVFSFSGERYVYYETVLGIFRKPFEGFSDAELAGTLQQRHGDGICLVEAESDECRIYSAPSIRQGAEPFYFTIRGTYDIHDNFAYSLMKSDALNFWKSDITSYEISRQDRFSGFMSSSGLLEMDEASGQWDTRAYPGNEDWLVICCYSKEDVPDCAADIADWIFYAALDERYFCEQENYSSGKELFQLWIRFYQGSSYETGREYLNQYREAVLENDWQQLYQGIADALADYYNGLYEQQNAYADEEISESAEETDDWEEAFMEQYQGNFEKEVFLGDGITGYRMVVTDAALGSRCYALLKSTDGGESWQMESGDPFGEMGQGIDFTFLNEKLGFATLSHNGGDEAKFFVTEDGGKSYEKVVMQGITVALDDGTTYNPYDYPQMPYEEDGKLYVLCGQGMDGDYDGGDAAGMALFESTDQGHTFVYKEIRVQ